MYDKFICDISQYLFTKSIVLESKKRSMWDLCIIIMFYLFWKVTICFRWCWWFLIFVGLKIDKEKSQTFESSSLFFHFRCLQNIVCSVWKTLSIVFFFYWHSNQFGKFGLCQVKVFRQLCYCTNSWQRKLSSILF